MMKLLEEFEEKLNDRNMQGQTKLLNIACTTKAKPRIVTMVSRKIVDASRFSYSKWSNCLRKLHIYLEIY